MVYLELANFLTKAHNIIHAHTTLSNQNLLIDSECLNTDECLLDWRCCAWPGCVQQLPATFQQRRSCGSLWTDAATQYMAILKQRTPCMPESSTDAHSMRDKEGPLTWMPPLLSSWSTAASSASSCDVSSPLFPLPCKPLTYQMALVLQNTSITGWIQPAWQYLNATQTFENLLPGILRTSCLHVRHNWSADPLRGNSSVQCNETLQEIKAHPHKCPRSRCGRECCRAIRDPSMSSL